MSPDTSGESQKSASDQPVRNSAKDTGNWRLLDAEIRASNAYAEALIDPGVLTADERDKIVSALQQIKTEYGKGTLNTNNPDVFTAIDARLTEIAGPQAGKMNAGRSRNERAVTALRLWLLDEMEGIGEAIAAVQRVLIQQAEGHVATLMPGYTHFQPAQVVSCSHWLLSFFWMLTRDQERLTSAIGRTSSSPLGSGSLAGTSFRIDRRALATAIGFSEVTENSMDAVSDFDFAAEFLFIASMLGIHISRLAEDLILYSNPALGFLTLDASYTAKHLIDPHKRNPEAIERSRGQAGRLLGDLTGFLSTLKSQPSTTNGDTQETFQTLFDAVKSLATMLMTMERVIDTLAIHPDRMWDALDENILASDLADYLIGKDVPYQEAYDIVEKLLERAEQSGGPISEMQLEDFQAESPAFAADVFAIFDYSRSAAQRGTIGGTASAAIRTQIRNANQWMMENGLA